MNASEYLDYQNRVAQFLAVNEVTPGCQSPKHNEESGSSFEPFFSWSPCACCQSPLGGDRETYLFALNGGGELEANICVDCVYFLEYGKLDDLTMMEIESAL